MTPPMLGHVIAAHRTQALVDAEEGHFTCVTRGKKGGLCCGDRVEFRPTGAGGGVITHLLPRENLLYRSDRFRSKLLAANLDQVLVVTAAVPTPNADLLNRCLVAAEAAGIAARIVANKADLAEAASYREHLRDYEALGYPVLAISAAQDAEALLPLLHGHTSLLVGASGVGKSTLLNALVPGAGAATQEISQALDSGRHTTTLTRLHRLDATTSVIDSPGIQVFGLAHLDAGQLQVAFPEWRERLGQCRFRNCRHLEEPGCAVRAGITTGRITGERWATYRSLLIEREAAERLHG